MELGIVCTGECLVAIKMKIIFHFACRKSSVSLDGNEWQICCFATKPSHILFDSGYICTLIESWHKYLNFNRTLKEKSTKMKICWKSIRS